MTVASLGRSSSESKYAKSETEVEDGGIGREPNIINALKGQSQSTAIVIL